MRIEPGETIEHQFDFAVVGGGMAGVLAAYELARDGAVCVLEREDHLACPRDGTTVVALTPSS